jgi:hypothetical protein
LQWVVNVTSRLLYHRERNPVPIAEETAWDPGPVLTGVKNLASTGIRCRIVQVAVCHTDYAIPANNAENTSNIMVKFDNRAVLFDLNGIL